MLICFCVCLIQNSAVSATSIRWAPPSPGHGVRAIWIDRLLCTLVYSLLHLPCLEPKYVRSYSPSRRISFRLSSGVVRQEGGVLGASSFKGGGRRQQTRCSEGGTAGHHRRQVCILEKCVAYTEPACRNTPVVWLLVVYTIALETRTKRERKLVVLRSLPSVPRCTAPGEIEANLTCRVFGVTLGDLSLSLATCPSASPSP